MTRILILTGNFLRAILRDRILYAVLGVAGAMILMVPSLSSFSMRQVQELAVTLSLSTVSVSLLVITLLLGSSSIWRDVECRYTTSILTMPVSRTEFLLSKFVSISLFLLICTLILGLGSAVVISLARISYPSDLPVHWMNITLALAGSLLKYQLLTAFALLLSTISTSFYLPFFSTLVIYFCGSASQEVFEYVSSEFGQAMSPLAGKTVTVAYYLLPNLSAFDYQVHAVYGLTVSAQGFLLGILYAIVYTSFLLSVAVYAFSRRQLP